MASLKNVLNGLVSCLLNEKVSGAGCHRYATRISDLFPYLKQEKA